MDEAKRWYDNIPELREHIEKLRDMDQEKRNSIFEGIKRLDRDFDTKLIDQHVMDFPMNYKRRWYDRDPYAWLIINALKYADRKLLQNVVDYLKGELPG
jgi:hypothetical protein